MKKHIKWKEWTETVLFTVPAILLVTVMMYIPFVMSGYYSLTEWNGIAKEPVFVGLENFKQILTGGSDYLGALLFTVKYTLGFVVFANVIALALAVAEVDAGLPGRPAQRPGAGTRRSTCFRRCSLTTEALAPSMETAVSRPPANRFRRS